MTAKVFGIGLAKTGTTSLFAALDQLGYRAATYRHMRTLGLEDWLRGDFGTDYLAEYDAATDLPLAAFYPELDRRYPGSKFILTVRRIDSWLASAEPHFAREPASRFGRDVRLAVNGITGFNRERFRRVYEAHVREAEAYFRKRADDLLVLDLIGGEGWERLCPFLGRPIPSTPFPHVQPGYRLPSEASGQRAGAGPSA